VRLNKKERELAKEIRKTETIVDWDPNFKFGPSYTFNADQFEAWVQQALPQAKGLKVVGGTDVDAVKKHGLHIGGDYYLYNRRVPTHIRCTPSFLDWRRKPWTERFGLKMFQAGRRIAYARFDRATAVPILSDVNVIDRPWMSLTPNEILTQRAGVRRAKGNVFVAGFGLGWFTREILKRKKVKHVTVVEVHEGVIEKLAEPLVAENKKRLTVIHDEAWHYLKTTRKKFDSYLFDIWAGWPNAHYDRDFQNFKREHKGKVWGWGDCATYPIS
jgi:hypothetical protein